MALSDLETKQHNVLTEIEWAGGSYETPACPLCRATKPVHKPDCRLQSALNEAVVHSDSNINFDISELQASPFPSTPRCPQCHTLAIYQSPIYDKSRSCTCAQGHTWTLAAPTEPT